MSTESDDHDELNAADKVLVDRAQRTDFQEELRHRILGDLTHEVRSPLTSVLGFSKLLIEAESSGSDEMATVIFQSAQRLRRGLDLLIRMAESPGEWGVNTETLNIKGEIGRTLEVFQPRAKQAGMTVNVDFQLNSDTADVDPLILDRSFTHALRDLENRRAKDVTALISSDSNTLLIQFSVVRTGDKTTFSESATSKFPVLLNREEQFDEHYLKLAADLAVLAGGSLESTEDMVSIRLPIAQQ